ncbi:MAG TPA: CAP domain-containing protein [Puia sp.]|nr:CAP domain-containing protein [Puia sp.]
MHLHRLIFGWLSLTAAASLPGPVAQPVETAEAPHKTATSHTNAGLSYSTAAISREILFFVNEFRRSKGLPALEANSFISSVALGHSRDMLTGKSPFGHEGFRQRIDRISGKLGRLHVAAENVASGPMDAREVVDGWLHSPGHRRNILGDFRLTGIGVAEKANGMIYFTQIFVR